jgi:hypothetical protein
MALLVEVEQEEAEVEARVVQAEKRVCANRKDAFSFDADLFYQV